MNHRRTFKHYSNLLKHYRRKRTDEEVQAYAQSKRQQRLANPTEAERRFSEILAHAGIPFERETIFLNGDRFIMVDFMLSGRKIAFEIDGAGHDKQTKYDDGRDRWLLEKHEITTIRFTNATILRNPDEAIRQIHLALNNQPEKVNLTFENK